MLFPYADVSPSHNYICIKDVDTTSFTAEYELCCVHLEVFPTFIITGYADVSKMLTVSQSLQSMDCVVPTCKCSEPLL